MMIELDFKTSDNNHQRIPRSRTVSSRYYDYESGSPHPYIRLGGKYLEDFGFNIGDSFTLNLEPDRITITKICPTSTEVCDE
ncbi:MAG: type I addiction module toxin, SymE family [Ignavibacteria bacterium]|nr:type I addiction module toxin, SymE family [Ignavibacteria bacterium]